MRIKCVSNEGQPNLTVAQIYSFIDEDDLNYNIEGNWYPKTCFVPSKSIVGNDCNNEKGRKHVWHLVPHPRFTIEEQVMAQVCKNCGKIEDVFHLLGCWEGWEPDELPEL